MSWTPTDEQVEKAASAMHPLSFSPAARWISPEARDRALDEARREARAVLVAVGPTIAAQALRDAAAETKTVASSASASWGADGIVTSDVKFTEVPALPQGAPTLLRARADTIEKEAGR